MRKRLMIVAAAMLSIVTLIAFQNCSMRSGNFSSASLGVQAQSTNGQLRTGNSPNPSPNPTPAPSPTPNPAPAPGAGPTPGPAPAPAPAPAPSPAAACMINANTQGTVMGISGQPDIKTSYAIITTYAGMPPYVPASTSVYLSATSSCLTESNFTNPGKCQTGGNTTCTKASNFSIGISVKCDSASATATSCSNFADNFDKEISLDDPDLGKLVSINASYSSNICDTTGASTATYIGGYYPNTPVGKFKITATQSIADGQVFTVKLIGVELLVGNDTTKKITLDGTYSAKIITQKACTP